jgi:hypothetical protein
VKEPLTFNAPVRSKIADSNSKTPDAIVREPKAVDAGTHIVGKVRLALTCDENALQKNSKLETEDKFLFYLMVAYIHSTHVLVGPIEKNGASCLASAFRQI